ncbi:hypothetical protein CN888_27645 [Bacillus wiedmannii]|nr:hypothetical protein CN888_27645 [Bacillus wiedmannii]
MLRVKPNNSGGDELSSVNKAEPFCFVYNNFLGRMFVSFVLRYNLPLDKEGIYCKTPKLDNHNHFVT